MDKDLEFNHLQQEKALQTIEDINKEREMKGNANVASGRFGELVANMIRYAESDLALKISEKEQNHNPFFPNQPLPGKQHVEPEELRGQTVINPT